MEDIHMPNPQPRRKKLTKAEIKAAQLAAEREALAVSLLDAMIHSNNTVSGELAALLGYLSNGENELADTAGRVLTDFFRPLARKANPDDADTLDYVMLKANRQKISAYRTYTFHLKALDIWNKEKNCHSDNYITDLVLNNPDTVAYYQGLQDAMHRVHFSDTGLLTNNMELITNYEIEAKEKIYRKKITFDGDEAFSKLTPEELNAWKAEWEPYFRERYHEEAMADMLLSDEDNLPVSLEERNDCLKRWGINWHIQWTKNWISYKPDREEFHRIKSGELTQAEWDAIEAHYSSSDELTQAEWDVIEAHYKHTDVIDLEDIFANPDDGLQEDIDSLAEVHWKADWEQNKQVYRDRYFKEVWEQNKQACRDLYFKEVWEKKWIADWEKKHGEVWHDAPEYDAEALENENLDWYECWTSPDDNKYLKECWLESQKNITFRRMDSFVSYTSKPIPLNTANYKTEQKLLEEAEMQVKEEEDKQLAQSLAGLSRKEAAARKREMNTAANFQLYDRMYEVFTHADLSFLTTKQYAEIKKAMEAALDSRVNPKPGRRRTVANAAPVKRWVPKDEAFEAMFKMISYMDKTEKKLLDLMDTEFAECNEYTKIQKNVKEIQKTLKQGSSIENMQILANRLVLNAQNCQEFMDRYPKKNIFHWFNNKRYKAMKALRDESRKQARILTEQMEKAGRIKALAVYEADEKRKKAQKALEEVRKLRNAPAMQLSEDWVIVEKDDIPAAENVNQADYEQRQNKIKKDLELVHKMQQERKSLPNPKLPGKTDKKEVQHSKRNSVDPKQEPKMVNILKPNNK